MKYENWGPVPWRDRKTRAIRPRRCVGTCQENWKAQKGRESYILFTFWTVGCTSRIHKRAKREREFVVDSGASKHMLSKKDLHEAELETVRVSKNPTVVMTANGEVPTKEEATVYVRELDLFMTVMLLENALPILSLGKFCEEFGTVTIGRLARNHISSKDTSIQVTIRRTWFVLDLLFSSTSPTSSSQEIVIDTEAWPNRNRKSKYKWRRGIAGWRVARGSWVDAGCQGKIDWWNCSSTLRIFQFFSWITHGAARKSGTGKRDNFTHFSKNLSFDVCLRTNKTRTDQKTKSLLHWQILGMWRNLWRINLESLSVKTPSIWHKMYCWKRGAQKFENGVLQCCCDFLDEKRWGDSFDSYCNLRNVQRPSRWWKLWKRFGEPFKRTRAPSESIDIGVLVETREKERMSAWKAEWEDAVGGMQLDTSQNDTLAVLSPGYDRGQQAQSLPPSGKVRTQITFTDVRIRRVLTGTLPYDRITNVIRDANSATTALNTLRLTRIQVNKSKKSRGKGSVTLLRESKRLGRVSQDSKPPKK